MPNETWESIGTNLSELVLDHVKREARHTLDITLPGLIKKATADVRTVLDEVKLEFIAHLKSESDDLVRGLEERARRALSDAVAEASKQEARMLLPQAVQDWLDHELHRYLDGGLKIQIERAAAAFLKNADLEKMARQELRNATQTRDQPQPHVPVRLSRDHQAFTAIQTAVSYRASGSGALHSGMNVMMVGPAGTGKSTVAEQLAAAYGLPFWFNGPVQSEYKLTGYKDAHGRYHSTPFREAYEHGGVYLFDEIDACAPQALVAFNTALAQGYCDFPDRGIVRRSPKFVCLAAANTYGRGANRMYVGRNQLDAATLDRFAMFDIGFDETLEEQAARAAWKASNPKAWGDGGQVLKWLTLVRKLRERTLELSLRHVITMRASIDGAKLLALGFPVKAAADATVWKGLGLEDRRKAAARLTLDQKRELGIVNDDP
jgi:MoxR-like ATPase